ncbi:MAG: hypothetical protein JW795_22405 [Chitinivibrionales bacterium]|nr:hypothetical protein [Chitinivibrionales bacterium]
MLKSTFSPVSILFTALLAAFSFASGERSTTHIVADSNTIEDGDSASNAAIGPSDTTLCSDSLTRATQPDQHKDTVFIWKASVALSGHEAALRAEIDNIKEKVQSFLKQGFGFGGGPLYGTYAINTRPVKDYIISNPELRTKLFLTLLKDHDFTQLFVAGGFGYGGLGSGVRIGGMGMEGEKNFISQPYGADSMVTLSMTVSWGGFLFERALYEKENVVFSSGGLFGGGSLALRSMKYKNSSITSVWIGRADVADFICFEAHSSVAYSLFQLFHIGCSVSVPLFFAVEGFSPRTSEFITINPGFAIKIIFGNLS